MTFQDYQNPKRAAGTKFLEDTIRDSKKAEEESDLHESGYWDVVQMISFVIEGLVEIGSCAFADSGVVKIKMPDSLKKIESPFFDPDIPEENFEGIIASRNSYASKWAEENGIAIEYVD